MQRRSWLLLGAAVLAGGAGFALFRPAPPEEFPLADLVPADAVFYAGFRDLAELQAWADRFPGAWDPDSRRRLDASRAHLAGPVAVYLDPDFRRVFLARLSPAAAAAVDSDRGAVVVAETPEALERHRRRARTLLDVPAFRALRSRVYLDLGPLALPGRLGDFAAVGMELLPGGVVRGRATYRPEVFRAYLEEYVQAPRTAGVPPGPLGAAFVDSLPRIWDEVRAAIPPDERDRAEREAMVLSRDYLEGGAIRDFLGRVGAAGGIALFPVPEGPPDAALWLDLPDEAARSKLPAMLARVAEDVARNRRQRGLAVPFELVAEGDLWQVRIPGETLSPVYAFRGDRWIAATSASVLEPAPAAAGGLHFAASVELEALFRSLDGFVSSIRDPKERERQARRLIPWRERLDRLDRIVATGRYTGEGLVFELRLTPRP